MAARDVDPEWVAFTAGLKPAIRISVDPGRAAPIITRLEACGAKVVRARTMATIGGRSNEILYVARSTADVLALRDAEAAILPGQKAGDLENELWAHREMGRRLGFPSCCVERFCARIACGIERSGSAGESTLGEDYRVAREAWVAGADGLLNHFFLAAGIRLITFYPCRYDCPAALRYARAVLQRIAQQKPRAAQEILRVLERPVAIAPSNARAVVCVDSAGVITSAIAPRDATGRVLAAIDADLAASLVGACVGPLGAVEAIDSVAPPWVVPFAASASRR